MVDWEVVASITAFIAIWGSLWYKLGKLTEQVKGHNKRLDDLTFEVKSYNKNQEHNKIRRCA